MQIENPKYKLWQKELVSVAKDLVNYPSSST